MLIHIIFVFHIKALFFLHVLPQAIATEFWKTLFCINIHRWPQCINSNASQIPRSNYNVLCIVKRVYIAKKSCAIFDSTWFLLVSARWGLYIITYRTEKVLDAHKEIIRDCMQWAWILSWSHNNNYIHDYFNLG